MSTRASSIFCLPASLILPSNLPFTSPRLLLLLLRGLVVQERVLPLPVRLPRADDDLAFQGRRFGHGPAADVGGDLGPLLDDLGLALGDVAAVHREDLLLLLVDHVHGHL